MTNKSSYAKFITNRRWIIPLALLLALSAVTAPAQAQTIHNVACDVAALRAAVDSANTDGTDSVLALASGCDYAFAADDPSSNGNALPDIVTDDGSLTFDGYGATLRRSNGRVCNIDDTDPETEFRLIKTLRGSATVTFDHVTVRDFCSRVSGGVILGYLGDNFRLIDSTFMDNAADNGGGVAAGSSLNLHIEGSTFLRNNTARSSGGVSESSQLHVTAINSRFIDNTSTNSGGVFNASSDATMNIVGCIFSGNHAGNNGGVLRAATTTDFNILNSTFVSNTTSGDGGVIWIHDANTVNITNSTFLDNAGTGGFTFYVEDYDVENVNNQLTMKNSIVSNQSDACNEAFDDGQDNFLTDSSCDSGDGLFNLGAPAGLETTLADNGGPTETLALTAISNALDVVTDCTAVSSGDNPLFANGDPVTTDQRGMARPSGEGCDSGAFELQPEESADPVPATDKWTLALLVLLLLCTGLLTNRRLT